jgi:signal transduction histidine kinase
LMEHRLEQPRFREQAGLIRRAAEHLNRLLSSILDLAKVEAGAMELAPRAMDLHALVRGAADFFAITANEKGLGLGATIAAGVPEKVVCDGMRLTQILNNLLSNAVKFTQAGRVDLDVEVDGDDLLFHVSDTGPGIAPGMEEVVFEKFRQGDARVSYEHGGTGLGLALSQGLAALMAGRITLRSRPQQGSCFTLRLPLSALPPAAGTQATAETGRQLAPAVS